MPCPPRHYRVVTIRPAFHVQSRGRCSGDRARGRAERLASGGEGVGPRPRGPAPDLPQHADHARRRGARPHPLPPGEDPGLVLHGPRQRGRRRSASRRRWAATTSARRSTATWACTSRAASSRGGSSPTTWAAPTGRRKGRDGNVHMADTHLGLIAMVSHLPAMLPVAVGCALAFRIREEKRVAVGWFGEGAIGARRRARGDELRRRPAAAGRLHLRQQPVGVLDADAPRVRGRAPRRPRRRPTASRASSSTAPTCSPSTARRSARSRRRATAAARR